MTDRPRYRNFRKAYGGDPDSAVLRDLHKRLTKAEGLLWEAQQQIAAILAEPAQMVFVSSPVQKNAAREEGVFGGGETPPPPKDQG